ncbi:MAG: hypothetical protein ABSD62_04965 [Candidatus Limnocylindrales bacterium]|jgi:hypothetical protein
MKTDATGGASANDTAYDNLEGRLSGRFAVELDRAERDYPALREKLVGGVRPASRRGRGAWPRLALPVTAAAALAIAVLVGAGLLPASPAPVPAGPASVSPPSGVVMGADGIPTQIDGQRVYRVTDKAGWQNLSGSFLLGGYGLDFVMSCPTWLPQPSAEADLLGQCGGIELAPSANEDPGSGLLMLAPQGSTWLSAWFGGPAIVVRVHAHDPEAAQCAAETRTQCEAALVVEAVVWPAVPTEIAGERVYRAADQASFPKSGSFLLGGLVTMPDVIPPCPALIDHTTAENDLIPYCTWEAIDGIRVAPKVDALSDLRNRLVVARVHIGDSEAASCPVAIQAQCKAAVVVEDVVWTDSAVPTNSGPTPVPTSAPSSTATPQIEPTGPTVTAPPTPGIGPLDADGVPTSLLDGTPVYRATTMPNRPLFLLGGRLTRDTTCAAPATAAWKPPSCGYWMLDGVKVGTGLDLDVASAGEIVVAEVERATVLAVCPGGSCTRDTIVIISIIYPTLEAPVVTPPAPPTPLTP